MKIDFTDPVLLICGGVIVICLAFLPWAIAKYRGLNDRKKDFLPFPVPADRDDLGIPPLEASIDSPFESKPRRPTPTPVPTPTSAPAPAAAPLMPAATKEVADRLESMNQRLSEMQAVLSKQTAAQAAGGMGQGFSPETLDNLLKIIGNVITQVDVLQKNLGVAKPAAPAPAGAASTLMAKPAVAPAPVVPKPG